MDRTSAKEKIKKLLAMAQSPEEHEAKVALLKAREMMAKYKLTKNELDEAAQQSVRTINTGVTWSNRRDPWIASLSEIIGQNYCCQNCQSRLPGKQTLAVKFIGLADDAEICTAVFQYAVGCIQSGIKAIRKENAGYSTSYVKKVCNSYGYGYVEGIGEAFEKQNEEKSAEWGLILVMPKEVQEATKNLEALKVNAITIDDIASSSYLDGYEAGKKFDPSHKLQPSLKKNLRLSNVFK